MRRTLFTLAVALATVDTAAAQAGVAGQWTGTWDGAGSGNFELILEKKDSGLGEGVPDRCWRGE